MEELNIDEFIENEKKVQSFKEFNESDTYARRELKKALQNKLFWKYIEKLGIEKDSNEKYCMYYYMNGKNQSINNTIIFKCREKMQPSKWYININETLTERIDFKPKFNVEYLYTKETVGHLKLEELQKQYTMQGLVEKYGLNFYQMKNIRYKRVSLITGQECFKTLPPASVIIKLKDVINPDYWFIFPEELKKR